MTSGEAHRLYLIDANVLIDAARDYYPMDQVPEFWDWIVDRGEAGRVKIPAEMRDEITNGNDHVSKWLKEKAVKDALLLDEEPDVDLVQHVIEFGYADDLTDDEIEAIGGDPFLIAYALADPESRCVVTAEASKPSRIRHNRHIPDVCADLDVPWIRKYLLTAKLGFSTGWKTKTKRKTKKRR